MLSMFFMLSAHGAGSREQSLGVAQPLLLELVEQDSCFPCGSEWSLFVIRGIPSIIPPPLLAPANLIHGLDAAEIVGTERASAWKERMTNGCAER